MDVSAIGPIGALGPQSLGPSSTALGLSAGRSDPSVAATPGTEALHSHPLLPGAAQDGTGPHASLPPIHCRATAPAVPGVCGEHPAASAQVAGAWNSTPAAESGTLIATVSTGSGPYDAAFDPANHHVYVVNRDSDNLTVLNGTSIYGTIGLTSYSFPDGIAYNPTNDSLYVAEYGPSTVAILHNDTVAATVGLPTGSAPVGVAYDPQNGYVYVADSGTNAVSVISGATVLTNVNVSSTPESIAYDPVNGYVYAVNSGAATVSVISGSSVIHSLGVGTSPQGIAIDPTSGLVYVANSGANTVSVIQGWTRIATLKVGSVPWGVEYDPISGLIYVANSNSNSVSLINGTTVASGTITVGAAPQSITYVPLGGALAVGDYSGNAISMISTALWVGPTSIVPLGNPPASADVGQNVTFNASVWGVGAGGDNGSIQVAPGGGLGCPSFVNLTYANGTGGFSVRCRPVYAGLYNISLVVTDLLGKSVRSATPFTVYDGPSAAVPIAQFDSLVATSSSDVGQRVTFSERITGGAGAPQPFRWSGLTAANCTSLTSAHPACTFPLPAVLFVGASYTDTNGAVAVSPILRFPVYAIPNASRPTANPSSADVGQSVTFSETVTGGPGTFRAFVWAGLPATGCSSIGTAKPKCPASTAGIWNVSVAVTDTNGLTVPSPVLAFRVHELPSATTPTASRTSLDVGQSVTFRTTASGGSGEYSYSWIGLPSFGCTDTTTSAPSCVPAVSGPIGVWVIVNDSVGGLSPPTAMVTVTVFPHPSVSAPDIAPSTAAPGDSIAIRASVTGGSGGNHYYWLGLPDGCRGSTAEITCRPGAVGSYGVRLAVNDSNGYNVTSAPSLLEVANRLPTLFGLDPTVFYGAILALVVASAILAVILLRRRRQVSGTAGGAEPPRYRTDDPRLARQRR